MFNIMAVRYQAGEGAVEAAWRQHEDYYHDYHSYYYYYC